MKIIAYVILSFLFMLIMLLIMSFFTLWESKLLSGIQSSHGPVFVGLFGLLQPFADGLKLLTKPVSMPTGVYYNIYMLSSMFSLTLSLLSWSVIPFNSNFVYADMNLGLIFMLVVSSLNVYTIIFSGWSSNSKYGLLGSVSSGSQMMSYELPMSLSVLPLMLFSSTANLTNIVMFQQQNFWFIIFFPAAFIFFMSSLAETNSTPFDLPEAESELVAGYNMEYSSMTFAVFFLAEYNHILVMSFLFTMLFLGGWNFFNFSLMMKSIVSILQFIFGYKVVLYYMTFKMNLYFLKICVYNYILHMIPINLFIFLLQHFSMNLMDYWFFMSNVFETFILVMKSMIVASLFVVISASVPSYKFTQLIILCWEMFMPAALMFFFLSLFMFMLFF